MQLIKQVLLMSLILNIETATELCSIAIHENGRLRVLKEASKQYSHASEITLLIEACISELNISMKDLDAVAVSKGPGSYTGLRIGISTAKGICYALDKPLIGINTLQSLAWAATEEKVDTLYCSMIDARRMEVSAAIFDSSNQLIRELNSYILEENSFAEYFSKKQKIVFCGNGSLKFKTLMKNQKYAIFKNIQCSAAHFVTLANTAFEKKEYEDLAYSAPLYFKAANITVPKKIIL